MTSNLSEYDVSSLIDFSAYAGPFTSSSILPPSSTSSTSSPDNVICSPSTLLSRSAPPTTHLPPFRYTTEPERWQAILTRDSEANNHFYYLAPSTKIYCRPTCPARRPIRHTVLYVLHPSEAISKGYRACKRCRPDQPLTCHDQRQSDTVLRAQEILLLRVMRGGAVPTLAELAGEVGMSKYYFQRVFKKNVGVSPAEYAKSLKDLLEVGPSPG